MLTIDWRLISQRSIPRRPKYRVYRNQDSNDNYCHSVQLSATKSASQHQFHNRDIHLGKCSRKRKESAAADNVPVGSHSSRIAPPYAIHPSIVMLVYPVWCRHLIRGDARIYLSHLLHNITNSTSSNRSEQLRWYRVFIISMQKAHITITVTNKVPAYDNYPPSGVYKGNHGIPHS